MVAVDRFAPTGVGVIVTGALLLALELGWIISWAISVGIDIGNAEGTLDFNDPLQRSTNGFLALAAPHTALIPAIFAIISDVVGACKNKGACTFGEIPPSQWFIFCWVVVPFDVLQFLYTSKLKALYFSQSTTLARNNYYHTLSILQLVSSSTIAFWAAFVWLWIVFFVRPRATKQ